MQAIELFLKARRLKLTDTAESLAQTRFVDEFIAIPDNPFLVSFPRTGSHWLRMIAPASPPR